VQSVGELGKRVRLWLAWGHRRGHCAAARLVPRKLRGQPDQLQSAKAASAPASAVFAAAADTALTAFPTAAVTTFAASVAAALALASQPLHLTIPPSSSSQPILFAAISTLEPSTSRGGRGLGGRFALFSTRLHGLYCPWCARHEYGTHRLRARDLEQTEC
jgi:hypothetical protein